MGEFKGQGRDAQYRLPISSVDHTTCYFHSDRHADLPLTIEQVIA